MIPDPLCVTLITERPEVVLAQFGTLVGSNYQAIIAGVRRLTASDRPQYLKAPNPFGRGDASTKIAAQLTCATSNARPYLAA